MTRKIVPKFMKITPTFICIICVDVKKPFSKINVDEMKPGKTQLNIN